MKIAVAVKNNTTSNKLCDSDEFRIFDVYDREIISENTEKTPRDGSSNIISFLKRYGVEVIISGCISREYFDSLKFSGIKPLTGAEGSPEMVVEDYICWSIKFDEDVCVK